MGERRLSPLSLNSLLAAVEAAPPVAAVDVLAGALAEAVGAREVSFLIADFSGRSLIRLGHSGGEGALRLQGRETAERVPLVGTPHGRALAAEIQHRLLPGAFTCEAGQFTLAAWLQPAGEIGGDTFDFSLERDTLHLSLTDAMGHTMDAALLATVLVGALRNARRRGVS